MRLEMNEEKEGAFSMDNFLNNRYHFEKRYIMLLFDRDEKCGDIVGATNLCECANYFDDGLYKFRSLACDEAVRVEIYTRKDGLDLVPFIFENGFDLRDRFEHCMTVDASSVEGFRQKCVQELDAAIEKLAGVLSRNAADGAGEDAALADMLATLDDESAVEKHWGGAKENADGGEMAKSAEPEASRPKKIRAAKFSIKKAGEIALAVLLSAFLLFALFHPAAESGDGAEHMYISDFVEQAEPPYRSPDMKKMSGELGELAVDVRRIIGRLDILVEAVCGKTYEEIAFEKIEDLKKDHSILKEEKK